MVMCGDVIFDILLVKVGGKGLFVKELEFVMFEGCVDIVVYLMKDVLVEFLEGLGLVIICECDDLCDVFVFNCYVLIDELLVGSVVGMLSLCCQCQLVVICLDLVICFLCGNVGIWLSKLDNGEYDVIIFVVVGLKCLQLEVCICQLLLFE